MNFLKNLNFLSKNGTKFTILTGGHQKYTQNLVSQIHKKNKQIKFLVLNKHYQTHDQSSDLSDFNIKEEYSQLGVRSDNINILNCNLESKSDLEDLLLYIKSNGIKVSLIKIDKRCDSFRPFHDLFRSFSGPSLLRIKRNDTSEHRKRNDFEFQTDRFKIFGN